MCLSGYAWLHYTVCRMVSQSRQDMGSNASLDLFQPRPHRPRHVHLHPPRPLVSGDRHDAHAIPEDRTSAQAGILRQRVSGHEQRHGAAEWRSRRRRGRRVPAFDQQEINDLAHLLPLPRHLAGDDAAFGDAGQQVRAVRATSSGSSGFGAINRAGTARSCIGRLVHNQATSLGMAR